MNFKNTLRITAIAGIALLKFTQSASAANHEIFVGFRSQATGDNDLIVNLGLFSLLPTSGIITNINADLSSQFGANWNTRTDLFFGAAGSNISGTRVIYASNFADGFSGSLNASQVSNVAAKIASLDQIKWDTSNVIQVNKGTQGTNSLVTTQTDANLSNWTVSSDGVGAFGQTLLTRSEFERDTDFSVITSKQFDLWSYTQGQTNFTDANALSYTLDSSGNISVVPEPSTYGLMGAGALAAAAFIRRRKAKAAKVA